LSPYFRSSETEPGSSVKSLERELEDLERASLARRKELESALALARARELVPPDRLGPPRKLDPNLPQYDYLRAQQPEWVIGVVLRQDSPAGGGEGSPTLIVAELSKGLPAEKAGFKIGDRLRSCNGIKLHDFGALRQIINAARDQELTISVVRTGSDEPVALGVTPTKPPAPPAPEDVLPHIVESFPGAGAPVVPQPDVRRIPPGAQPPPAFAPGFNPDSPAAAELAIIKNELKQLRELVSSLLDRRKEEGKGESREEGKETEKSLEDRKPGDESGAPDPAGAESPESGTN
jgi:membrane-associated protease RseP (regulator of RpoE activity)